MKRLDHQKIRMEKIEELSSMTGYVPLALHIYLPPNYWDVATEQALKEYYQKRTDLQCAKDKRKYLMDDLLSWINEHKSFKDIIING